MAAPESQRKPDVIKKWLHIANVPIGLALIVIGVVIAFKGPVAVGFVLIGIGIATAGVAFTQYRSGNW